MEIITTHRNTDFDALASVFAASILYPGAERVLPSTLNANIREFLSIHKDHLPFRTPKEIDPRKIHRLIVVDTGSWGRLEGFEILEGGPDLDIHLWDHHREPGDIKAGWSCRREVGAVTTLLVLQIAAEKKRISPIEATLFLAGIYEDTGNLTFPCTTADDARAIAFLLDQEADLNLIKTFLRPLYDLKQKEILTVMLNNERRMRVNGFQVSFHLIPIEGHTPGLASVLEIYKEIANVDVSFGIFSEARRNQCIVIGRSSADTLDIGTIMRKMGGGGHPNAGSALLKSMQPEAVEDWCRELIMESRRGSVQISDLMSHPVETVSPETSMKDAALILRERGYTGLPVVKGHRVVGIISRRDFRKIRNSSKLRSPVRAFMSAKIISIGPEGTVAQAARLMAKNDVGRLPVIEDGTLRGILTRSDAMKYYYHLT